MIHLLGFSQLHSDQGQSFLALYDEGDICIFTDAGLMLASTLPLRGPGYCLQHPTLDMPASDLPTLDHNAMLDLLAEHGPCTSWY
ncbi:hypothetical protein A11A3_12820 [Alcanivorax hongdengensis A-11-3]|uniref:Uncharacterized protein n=1 Tax=Alcanivorax hongdengensis A-11-3 TaxID=1177179 RepID=L0WCZ2_9GAMM|nr:hypothetical protein [Alcanivorax hongdengensis]EKF73610.1 hypothetical protein A11A3_12820 [Alcanivorax hongdengensis A-11-3]